MSTGNNLEEIYSNSIKILKDLIAFKTVSGENNTQLIDYCDNILNSLGAVSFKTYDEEKEVANKAPVDDIMVQSISLETEKKESKIENFVTNFNYIIKFADFYFEDSAIMLKNRLFEEYNIENILIKKLSQNNFRVYKGPYKNFEQLKKGFQNIENLEFDSIEIIKL